MKDMGAELKRKTAAQIAAETGRGIDAIRKRFRSAFPDVPFSATAELTAEQISILSGKSKRKKRTVRKAERPEKPVPIVRTKADKSQAKAARKKPTVPRSTLATFALYAVLSLATIASIYNVLRVATEIADPFTAFILTGVLALAAVVFVASGVRHALTLWLVGLLIGFEGLCNLVRIYGGLTHWEKAVPTSFLATVCDVFGTGTYGTAKAIGLLTAALICGVQYCAIFEIRKNKI